jgi:hypothetical protein
MKKLLILCVLSALSTSFTFADEGMWLLNSSTSYIPTIQKKYNFKITDDWLEKVRLSSARLAGGCSASFVSKTGLVMTNHHCAHSCIEQLSKSGRDYIANGFTAKKQSEEVRCPEIEVNRLVEIKDVTTTVQKQTKGLMGAAYNDAQKSIKASLEKECSAGNDAIRCDVVTLYHGGAYHLYRYQRYQDVRLVFAPELAIAFFGGDPDNFMFPRYDLDMSLLRVYDQGKPLNNPNYFNWSTEPAKAGDLSFVTGHPGSTSRLLTIAELEYIRDVSLIRNLIQLSELRGLLSEFKNRGPEQKRIAEAKFFSVENTLKAMKGKLSALQDSDFFAKKIAAEKTLQRKILANPKWKKDYGTAWSEIAAAQKQVKAVSLELNSLEYNRSLQSKLYGYARSLVRSAEELQKPNGSRLAEYTDAKLPTLKLELFSEAPIYDEFEIAMLTFSLTKMRENLGPDHAAIKRIFGQRSPEEIAKSVVEGTKLKDSSFRKKMFDLGPVELQKAIQSSSDPLIQFAKLIDAEARPVRKNYEDRLEPIFKKNSERIAQAQFAVYGSGLYPDATFTLRLSYGQIKGYDQHNGFVNPITTLAGAFDRHTGRDPFALPDSWLKAKSKMNLSTPMNFCSTNDIIGGNSGSPVINSKAEIIGLIFDGNIQSLGGDYGFDETVNRAVAVHSSGIIEALSKVYTAEHLVSELLGQ